MTSHVRIAIVGGGLGGLTLARVLHVRGIDATVFELEPDRHARVQGGMLDIHTTNGQQALRAADLWEPFTRLIHAGGASMRILDHEATVLREEADDGSLERPEVDRGQLRDLLIDSLPEGCVRWGTKMTSAHRLDDSRHELVFADDTVVTTDLLVGADGAWSKIRPLLTEARPAYAGVSFVETDLWDADTDHPEEATALGGGMLFALRGQTGILGHRESDASLHVYLGLRVDEDWIDTIDFADTVVARREVLAHLDGWAPALRGLIQHGDTPLVPRRINALPVGITWPRVPGVTLLGDAAHVMSPFAGEGANLAMYDGSELALSIAAHLDDLETGLGAYEEAMFTRARKAAAESAENLDVIFSDNSPQGLLAMFAGFDAEQADDAAADVLPYAAG